MEQIFTYSDLLLIFDAVNKLPEGFRIGQGSTKTGLEYSETSKKAVRSKVLQYAVQIEKAAMSK